MSDSYWVKTSSDAECPSLEHTHETDVAIIGGGLTGLHAALKILEDSPYKKVTLIEADRICGDASGRTMGKVTTSHSRIFQHLSGDEGTKYVDANREGFKRILHIIDTYEIDCNFQRVTNYIFTSASSHIDHVRNDFESMKRSGLDVEWIEPRNDESREIALGFIAGIRHPEQAVYHPRKFALGLLQAIQLHGGQVYERTIATDISEHETGVRITLESGAHLDAKKAIVATRIGLPVEEPFTNSISVWRKHIMAHSFDDVPVKNAYICYEQPVTSFRPDRDFLLVGGGDAHVLPFEDEKHYHAIESWVKHEYIEQNALHAKSEAFFWWGEDADSADMLPLIGRYRKGSQHIFMATGYCGWGMTKSAFAGIMLSGLVSGTTSSYEDLFDPWRF